MTVALGVLFAGATYAGFKKLEHLFGHNTAPITEHYPVTPLEV